MGKHTFLKRALSIVLTLVMAVSMLPSAYVKAAEEAAGVTVYFELPEGTTAADWGVNVWSDVVVTGNKETTVRPAEWGEGDGFPTLLTKDGVDGWGYVTLTGDVQGLQVFQKTSTGVENIWNAGIKAGGYTEAWFDITGGKWYTAANKQEEIAAPETRNIFILAGDAGLAGSSWDPADANNELKNVEGTTTYSITYKNVAPGSYPYKILQDPENKGWDLAWGNGSGGGGNRSLEVSAPADVTISIDTEKKPAADEVDTGVDVAFDYIEAIVAANANIPSGKETALAATGTYYDKTGKATEDVALTYALKAPVEGVTLADGKITVAADAEVEAVTLLVTAGAFTQEMNIPVVKKVYKVTINMYSQDLAMEPGVSDIYIYEKDGAANTILETTGTVEDEDNGVTWVTGTVELPFNSLGIIARDQAGTWDGGQDGNQFFVVPEDQEEITLWYEYGKKPVTEKPTITKAEPRFLMLEYTNPNFPAGKTPQFYSWTTGYAAERIDFESKGSGKWEIKVPVKPSCTKVDFVLVIDASGSDWIKDGGDHSVSFPLDQNLVYASMNADEEPQLSAPYNKGYELQPKENQISFYYRDDTALAEGKLADMEPKLELDGTLVPMKYNAENKRFEYVKTGLQDGRMLYRYYVEAPAEETSAKEKKEDITPAGLADEPGADDTASGASDTATTGATDAADTTTTGAADSDTTAAPAWIYVLDKYNANVDKKVDAAGTETAYSYVDYYNLSATVTASVLNPGFNYNENDVVSFEVSQNKTAGQPDLIVSSASVDVSSLGGSSALAIVPDLKAVTIAATMDTPLGVKSLPIVVTDQFGNEYTTTATVEVTARQKKDDKDFDWDEACIYFMVTDRFFDGNPANNSASDPDAATKTYGKENEGLYHGGDFAGVTQKLDYLADLGINTIWITPIVENIPGVTVTGTGSEDVPYNSAYHGYWASDFTKLNPTLGTDAEFQTMIEEAHKRGIRIMVDIVVNHAGYNHGNEEIAAMVRTDDDIVSGDDQKDSLSDLPDFKTEDPAVSAKLVEWQTQWIKNFAIDYFRVDTVKHVEGDTWAELKNSLTKVNPSFKMIGEYAGAGYASNGGSLGTGKMDSDLDFDFNGMATSYVSGNIEAVEKFLVARNAALNNTYLTGQFIGSHDEDGFKYNLINGNKMTEAEADAASLVAATLQITAKGQPVIYYGEELGQTGANNYPYQTNRYDFKWEETTNENNFVLKHYKKLLQIRKDYVDVFARGNREVVTLNDTEGYDVVKRTYGADSLFVCLNIKDAATSVPVQAEANAVYRDLYSGATVTADAAGILYTSIPKSSEGGTAIYVKAPAEQPATEQPASEQPTSEQPTSEQPTTQQPADTSVKVTDVTISGSYTKVAAGQTVTLTAKVEPEDAANKELVWTSNNESYATVQNGKVKLLSAGAGKTVIIKAAAADGSGEEDTYEIKIMKNKVTKITISGKKSVKAGKKVKLKATVKVSGKTSVNKTLTWSTSNKKYATVTKKGVVTTKKAGKGKTVKITAKATDGTNKKATFKLKITK